MIGAKVIIIDINLGSTNTEVWRKALKLFEELGLFISRTPLSYRSRSRSIRQWDSNYILRRCFLTYTKYEHMIENIPLVFEQIDVSHGNVQVTNFIIGLSIFVHGSFWFRRFNTYFVLV